MTTKCLVATLALLATTTACGGGPRPIAYYPPLKSVHEGMNKSEVRLALGRATEEKVKRKPSENLFFQGPIEDPNSLERRITEGWIYRPEGWLGSIEVYFDSSGKVIGINHGEG